MNIKVIIAGVLGLAAGGVGGYLLCHSIESARVDKLVSDKVQQELDAIRGSQREKIMENETKKSRIINAIPHFDANDIAKGIINDSGYSEKSKDSKDETEPEGEPDSDDDGLPFEQGEVEEHNI